MIDKKKIGLFIKENRQKLNWTRETLAEKLSYKGEEITSQAIAQWEQGINCPLLSNLNTLSKLFNVTIDELLDGEKIKNQDFSKTYPLLNRDWVVNDYNNIYFNDFQKEVMKMLDRFNFLLNLYINNNLTRMEAEEFKFILNNYYDFVDGDSDISGLTTYDCLKMVIPSVKLSLEDKPLIKKRWDVKSHLALKRFYEIDFDSLCHEILSDNKVMAKRFQMLDFYEKDMFFNMLQKLPPYYIDRSGYGSKGLKDYKKEFGRDYDKEKDSKKVLKFFISNGALLNRFYMNEYYVNEYEKREIDRLEQAYLLCKADIVIRDYFNGKERYVHIKNTDKNFFLTKYFYRFREFTDIDGTSLYKMFINNDKMPRDFLLNIAANKDIDIKQEKDLLDADIKFRLRFLFQYWNDAKQDFEDRKKAFEILDLSLKNLQSGLTKYVEIEKEEIGGNYAREMLELRHEWNSYNDLDNVKKCRDKTSTEMLLSEIDDLTYDQIIQKYFPIKDREDD